MIASLRRQGDFHMLSTILIVLLVLALLGALPNWGHSRAWGYGPSGGLGLLLVIVVVLLAMGRI
jgi:hypothetical protein